MLSTRALSLVRRARDLVIDELRAVVGRECLDGERERAQEPFEHRHEEALGDAFARADELKLRDLIDQIERVQALGAVEVPLVDRIDPHEPGTALGMGPAPFANRDRGGPGRCDLAAPALAGGRMAKVVQMSVGEPREPLKARVVEHGVCAFAPLAGGRPGQGPVQGIDLGEPADVLTGVAPGEGPPRWAAAVAQAPGRAVLGDEAGQLRSRPPAHLAREAAHHSLVGLARLPVPEPAKRPGNELVARAALQGVDLDRLGAVEERADLVQGPYSVGLKHHDHLPMMPGSGPLQAHFTLESPVPLQAHGSLEKAEATGGRAARVRCIQAVLGEEGLGSDARAGGGQHRHHHPNSMRKRV